MKRRLLIIPVVAAVALGGGAAYALATGDDDAGDTPITGSALDRASAAALAHTGGGRVTGSEAGDEEGAYEIEVTLPDGAQVDVHLDDAFRVIGTQDDAEHGDHED
jgi:hypothetical protein